MKYSKLIVYSTLSVISLAGLSQWNELLAQEIYQSYSEQSSGDHHEGGGGSGHHNGHGDGEHHHDHDSDGGPCGHGTCLPEGGYYPPAPIFPNPIYGCEVLGQNGETSATCEASSTGPFQCYADVIIYAGTQQRVYGSTCTPNPEDCLWNGLSRVEPCY